jgi:hypothetical protein
MIQAYPKSSCMPTDNVLNFFPGVANAHMNALLGAGKGRGKE